MDEIDLETTTFGEALRAVKFSRKVSTLLFVTMLTKEGEKYHDKALGILCEWARSQGTDHLTVWE